MMQHAQSDSQRINAAMAVAILVGHEENNEYLRLTEELTQVGEAEEEQRRDGSGLDEALLS